MSSELAPSTNLLPTTPRRHDRLSRGSMIGGAVVGSVAGYWHAETGGEKTALLVVALVALLVTSSKTLKQLNTDLVTEPTPAWVDRLVTGAREALDPWARYVRAFVAMFAYGAAIVAVIVILVD